MPYLFIKKSTTPPPPLQPPAAPTGLALSIVTVTIHADWDDNGESSLLGYNIYCSDNGAAFSKLNTSLLTESTYINTGVQEGHTYTYRATAVNATGESNPSSQESILFPTLPPGDLTLKSSITMRNITWYLADGAGNPMEYYCGQFELGDWFVLLDSMTQKVFIRLIEIHQPDDAGHPPGWIQHGATGVGSSTWPTALGWFDRVTLRWHATDGGGINPAESFQPMIDAGITTGILNVINSGGVVLAFSSVASFIDGHTAQLDFDLAGIPSGIQSPPLRWNLGTITTGTYLQHGSMVNPACNGSHGFDGRAQGFDASLEVHATSRYHDGVIELMANDALVTAQSRPPYDNLEAKQISIGTITNGPFLEGEKIFYGSIGTVSGVVFRDCDGSVLRYGPIKGAFTSGVLITGETSGASAVTTGNPISSAYYNPGRQTIIGGGTVPRALYLLSAEQLTILAPTRVPPAHTARPAPYDPAKTFYSMAGVAAVAADLPKLDIHWEDEILPAGLSFYTDYGKGTSESRTRQYSRFFGKVALLNTYGASSQHIQPIWNGVYYYSDQDAIESDAFLLLCTSDDPTAAVDLAIALCHRAIDLFYAYASHPQAPRPTSRPCRTSSVLPIKLAGLLLGDQAFSGIIPNMVPGTGQDGIPAQYWGKENTFAYASDNPLTLAYLGGDLPGFTHFEDSGSPLANNILFRVDGMSDGGAQDAMDVEHLSPFEWYSPPAPTSIDVVSTRAADTGRTLTVYGWLADDSYTSETIAINGTTTTYGAEVFKTFHYIVLSDSSLLTFSQCAVVIKLHSNAETLIKIPNSDSNQNQTWTALCKWGKDLGGQPHGMKPMAYALDVAIPFIVGKGLALSLMPDLAALCPEMENLRLGADRWLAEDLSYWRIFPSYDENARVTLAYSGGMVTCTTSSAHGCVDGDRIELASAGGLDYRYGFGPHAITRIDATHFSYTDGIRGAPPASQGGIVWWKQTSWASNLSGNVIQLNGVVPDLSEVDITGRACLYLTRPVTAGSGPHFSRVVAVDSVAKTVTTAERLEVGAIPCHWEIGLLPFYAHGPEGMLAWISHGQGYNRIRGGCPDDGLGRKVYGMTFIWSMYKHYRQPV